jgi:streptomycin 6-kinase
MLKTRLSRLAEEWKVTITKEVVKPATVLAYGTRQGQEVVIKLVARESDEWLQGRILEAWNGKGAVACLAVTEGACLMPRISPATPLTSLCDSGKDGAACEVIVRIIQSIPKVGLPGAKTAEELGQGFDRYLKSQNNRLDRAQIADARAAWFRLCATQTNPHLRHGDLQHYNILKDDKRGWLAIDPKGVIAEVEFELGAMLRNPRDRPALLTRQAAAERAKRVATRLSVDPDRVLAWGLVQAVLSAIWQIEDTGDVDPDFPSLRLAAALRS